jgi:hypothetical protein
MIVLWSDDDGNTASKNSLEGYQCIVQIPPFNGKICPNFRELLYQRITKGDQT